MKWLAMVMLSLILAACAPAQEDPVRIGVAVELTGYGAESGENIRKGTELAAAQVNAQGGIRGRPLDLVFEDTQTDATLAVTAMTKLAGEGLPVVLSGWTFETVAMAPLAEQYQVNLVSVSAGGLSVGELNQYTFRTWPSDATETRAAAQFLMTNDMERAVILCTQGIWEDGLRTSFAEQYRELGGTIAEELCTPEKKEWRTLLSRAERLSPDAIYLAVDVDGVGPLLKQAEELGIDLPFAYTSWAEDPRIALVAGGAMDNLYYSKYEEPLPEFREEFMRAYGEEPRVPADVAYDTVHLLAEIMRERGTSAEAIQEGLDELDSYSGASGIIRFDANGDRIGRDVMMLRFENGEPVPAK